MVLKVLKATILWVILYEFLDANILATKSVFFYLNKISELLYRECSKISTIFKWMIEAKNEFFGKKLIK